MNTLARTFRDPLLHFLVAGAVLYGVVARYAPDSGADDVIKVDRAAMLGFVQYRSKAFEPGAAERLYASFPAAERERLIIDYIREEALYREAKKLGVAENDYVIRERMVQSALFVASAGAGDAEPGAKDVADYFAAHAADYRVEPSVTFTHVFFAGKEGESRARATAGRLARVKARFEDAPRYGERFPFHVNYVERTFDYVASQFGDAAAKTIFDEKTPLDRWIGPLQSEYGWHVVLISGRTPAHAPTLEEVSDRVAEDAKRAIAEKAEEKAVADAVARYRIVRAPDLAAPALEVPAPKPSARAP